MLAEPDFNAACTGKWRAAFQPVVLLLGASELSYLVGIAQGAEGEGAEPVERSVIGGRQLDPIGAGHYFEHGERFERKEMVVQGESAARDLKWQRALRGYLAQADT